ncbi:MAG: hypothetical protein JNM31_03905 [Flavobacteriales bacterium]|nr:hypothetical protein [Flavobacteriales bacterium]
MKPRIPLLATGLFLLVSTTAQVKVKSVFSPVIFSEKSMGAIGLLPGHAGSLVVVGATTEPRLNKNEWAKGRLEVFDRAKLGPLRMFEPTMKPYATQVPEQVLRLGGRNVLVASNTSQKEQAVTLMWANLEPTLTKPNYPLDELVRFEWKNMNVRGNDSLSYGPWTGQRLGLQAVYAHDSARVLLHTPELRIDENRSFRVFLCLDRDMKLLWHEIVRSEGSARAKMLDVALDANGRAVLISTRDKGGKPVPRKDGKGSDATVETTLMMIDTSGVSSIPWELFNDFYPLSARLLALPDGRMVYGAIRGGIDAKGGQVVTGATLAFLPAGATKLEEVQHIALPKEDKPRNYAHMDLSMVRMPDGFALVGEAMTVKTSVSNLITSAQKQQRVINTYYREDVLVMRTDASGKLQWQTLIPRSVVTPTLDRGALVVAPYKDKLMLFVPDDEANIELRKKSTEPPAQVELKKCVTQLVTFDGEGKPRFRAVLMGAEGPAMFAPVNWWWSNSDLAFALVAPSPTSDRFMPVRLEFAPDSK